MFSRITALLLWCGAAAACSTGDGADLAWNGTVAELDGHLTTTNPATPALSPGTTRVTPLWTSPTGDVAEWAEPSKVVEGAGNYYVIDRRSTRVHIVGSDGRLVKSFGRRGPGPEEIMVAGDIGFVGNHVVVRDMGKHTIEVYDPQGQFVKSISIGRVGFGFGTVDPDGMIVARLASGGQKWLRVGLESDTSELPIPTSVQGPAACRRISTFGDRIAQLDCAVPMLTVSNQSGVVERVIIIQRDTIRATEAQLQSVREQLQREMAASPPPPGEAQALLESVVRDARVVKPWRAARRDAVTGVIALWEQPPANIGGGNARVHLLSPDGVYLDVIAFDDEWVDFTIRNSRIAALALNDSTGVPQLAVHAIELPPDALESAAAAASRKAPR